MKLAARHPGTRLVVIGHRLPAVSSAQDLPHLPRERAGRDRLLEKGDARVEDAVLEDGVVGVAGHEEHLHLRPQRREALGELPPAHAGHHDVGQQQVDLRPVLLADEQRLAAVRRLEHDVAVAPKDASARRRAPGRRPRRAGSSRCPRPDSGGGRCDGATCGGTADAREVDLERRALARLAVDPDVPPALLDDPEDRREPEARALARAPSS